MLRFTKKEREKLQALIESGISLRACARSLRRHHTALLYEMKRGAGAYNADEAHQDSLDKNELRNDKLSANYLSRRDRNYVGERLDRGWSHEQIAGRAKKAS